MHVDLHSQKSDGSDNGGRCNLGQGGGGRGVGDNHGKRTRRQHRRAVQALANGEIMHLGIRGGHYATSFHRASRFTPNLKGGGGGS